MTAVQTDDGPRRRNAAATKEAILAAARVSFGSIGYAQAGLREIAAQAGVNAALVARYFGSKEKLFEAAIEAITIDRLVAGGRENFGKHAVHYLIDAPGIRFNPLTMMILAAQDPAVRQLSVDALERQFVTPLAAWLGGPNGASKVSRMLVLLTGLFTYWKILPLRTFAPIIDPGVRAWLEQALQGIVDED